MENLNKQKETELCTEYWNLHPADNPQTMVCLPYLHFLHPVLPDVIINSFSIFLLKDNLLI